jgi:hypothetical protein
MDTLPKPSLALLGGSGAVFASKWRETSRGDPIRPLKITVGSAY